MLSLKSVTLPPAYGSREVLKLLFLFMLMEVIICFPKIIDFSGD